MGLGGFQDGETVSASPHCFRPGKPSLLCGLSRQEAPQACLPVDVPPWLGSHHSCPPWCCWPGGLHCRCTSGWTSCWQALSPCCSESRAQKTAGRRGRCAHRWSGRLSSRTQSPAQGSSRRPGSPGTLWGWMWTHRKTVERPSGPWWWLQERKSCDCQGLSWEVWAGRQGPRPGTSTRPVPGTNGAATHVGLCHPGLMSVTAGTGLTSSASAT